MPDRKSSAPGSTSDLGCTALVSLVEFSAKCTNGASYPLPCYGFRALLLRRLDMVQAQTHSECQAVRQVADSTNGKSLTAAYLMLQPFLRACNGVMALMYVAIFAGSIAQLTYVNPMTTLGGAQPTPAMLSPEPSTRCIPIVTFAALSTGVRLTPSLCRVAKSFPLKMLSSAAPKRRTTEIWMTSMCMLFRPLAAPADDFVSPCSSPLHLPARILDLR